MIRPIGGYFGWEFQSKEIHFIHSDGALVNSGRHALEFILLGLDPVQKLYVPYFTCDSVLQPINRLGIPYEFYHLNNRLEIDEKIELRADEYLLYTNYFGVKDEYVEQLYALYQQRLIIDNAQALFAQIIPGCSQFFSPRKFVGCPEGGIAYPQNQTLYVTFPQGKSYDCCASLLQRADDEISLGYKSFKENDSHFCQMGITKMSELTRRILNEIDYSMIQGIRRRNFQYLHSYLADTNGLEPILTTSTLNQKGCPMVYPYRTNDQKLRNKLISNQVFVAKYWPNIMEWCSPNELEYQLTEQIIPLPIDQRYGEEEMRYIVELIK
jgi:hypothetical protein